MTADQPKARFPWWAYWLAFAIIVVFTLWPVASVTVAYLIADSHGCALDEGSVHPCIVGGQDLGEWLSIMGVLGWFMLATVPLGLGAFIVWLIVLLIHRAAWGRAQGGPGA